MVDSWVGWYQMGIVVCDGKVLLSGLSGDWCMLRISDSTAFSLIWNYEIQ